MGRETILLKDWIFKFGTDKTCLDMGRKVSVPHTWNIEEGTEDSMGIGWYKSHFFVPEQWNGKTVRIRFAAVYHTAIIYLNGKKYLLMQTRAILLFLWI